MKTESYRALSGEKELVTGNVFFSLTEAREHREALKHCELAIPDSIIVRFNQRG